MKTYITPFALSMVALTAVAEDAPINNAWIDSDLAHELLIAENSRVSNIWSEVYLSGESLGRRDLELSQEIKTDSEDSSSSATPQRRTRMLTGYEFEQHRYKNNSRQTFKSLIFADGATKVHENWSIRYLLKEMQAYQGKDDQKNGPSLLHTEIAPIYQKWVSPNFNYAVEFAYENVTGNGESAQKTYWIYPSAAFSFGDHFLFVDSEFSYFEHDKAYGFETEPLYLYHVNPKISVGGKVLYVKENNDFRWKEWAVKPLVQYRFDSGIYLELRYERGRTSNFQSEGHDYNNYAVYSEIPLTKNFNWLIDAAFRKGDQHGGNEYSWGDRNGVFAKFGIISHF